MGLKFKTYIILIGVFTGLIHGSELAVVKPESDNRCMTLLLQHSKSGFSGSQRYSEIIIRGPNRLEDFQTLYFSHLLERGIMTPAEVAKYTRITSEIPLSCLSMIVRREAGQDKNTLMIFSGQEISGTGRNLELRVHRLPWQLEFADTNLDRNRYKYIWELGRAHGVDIKDNYVLAALLMEAEVRGILDVIDKKIDKRQAFVFIHTTDLAHKRLFLKQMPFFQEFKTVKQKKDGKDQIHTVMKASLQDWKNHFSSLTYRHAKDDSLVGARQTHSLDLFLQLKRKQRFVLDVDKSPYDYTEPRGQMFPHKLLFEDRSALSKMRIKQLLKEQGLPPESVLTMDGEPIQFEKEHLLKLGLTRNDLPDLKGREVVQLSHIIERLYRNPFPETIAEFMLNVLNHYRQAFIKLGVANPDERIRKIRFIIPQGNTSQKIYQQVGFKPLRQNKSYIERLRTYIDQNTTYDYDQEGAMSRIDYTISSSENAFYNVKLTNVFENYIHDNEHEYQQYLFIDGENLLTLESSYSPANTSFYQGREYFTAVTQLDLN